MMDDITTIGDMEMVIAIGSGFPGVKEWVQFAGDPTGVVVGGGVQLAQPLDGGVGMLRRVVDLADVHHRRHPGVELRDAAVQLVDHGAVEVGGRVDVHLAVHADDRIDARSGISHGLHAVGTNVSRFAVPAA